jgi:hypothetical protein
LVSPAMLTACFWGIGGFSFAMIHITTHIEGWKRFNCSLKQKLWGFYRPHPLLCNIFEIHLWVDFFPVSIFFENPGVVYYNMVAMATELFF